MHEKRDDQFEHMDVYELRTKARALVRELESTTTERNRLDGSIEAKQNIIESMGRKLAAYEAGQDTTPAEEGRELTGAQMWHKLLTADETTRMAMLTAFWSNLGVARACFEQDHEGRIADLLHQLDTAQTDLARTFGLDEDDVLPSLGELTVTVRALRNVMVDGIARRATVLDDAIDQALDEYDESFPQEAGTQEKLVAVLKEKGIDVASICRYTWEGAPTDACDGGVHECRLVNPLHAESHACDPDHCGQELTHEDAERLATQ